MKPVTLSISTFGVSLCLLFALYEDFLLEYLSALNPSPIKKVCNRCGTRARTWGVWTRGLPEPGTLGSQIQKKKKNPKASTAWLGEGEVEQSP